MSYYEGLPIYKAAMDLVVRLDQATLRFPKRHKYALGARLVDTATDIVMWIARAHRRNQREQALDRLCARIDELKLQVQIGKEVQAFESFNQFAQVIEQVVAVSKQAEAWRAYQRRVEQQRSAVERQRFGPEPGPVSRPSGGAP